MNNDNSLRVKKVSLVDAVMEQMLEAVKSGRFQPGKKIPSEKVLAQEFGVSRTTLREAFKRLETAGTLDIRQGDGTYLLDNKELFSEEEKEDALQNSADILHLSEAVQQQINKVFSLRNYRLSHYVEAREILELGVVELVIQRATPEDLEKLRQNLEAQSTALQNSVLFYQLDCSFHHTLVEISGNLLLLEFWSMLLPFMQEQIGKVRDVAESAYGYHKQLYEAILKKDVETARQVVEEHMRIVPGRMLFGSSSDEA